MSYSTNVCAIWQKGEQTNNLYNEALGNTTPHAKTVNCVSNIVLLALFAIGVIAASGAFSGSAVGWTTLALGGVYFFGIKLWGGRTGERIPDLVISGIIAAVMLIFGVLGGTGVLSAPQTGCAVFGTLLATAGVKVICLMLMLRTLRTRITVCKPQVPEKPLLAGQKD